MTTIRLRHEPPANEVDFEDLCLRLLRSYWKIPGLELLGRRGEHQHGIDILDIEGRDPLHAAQCKLRDRVSAISPAEIIGDIEKALNFEPRLGHFAILTTAKVSVKAQQTIIRINREHRAKGLFSVELFTWSKIARLLDEYTEVRDAVYKSLAGETAARIEGSVATLATFVHRAVHVDSDALHSEINQAKVLVEQHDFQLARFVLERLRNANWEHMGPRHRFRLLSNLAATHLGDGHLAQAASLFLEAKGYQPDDEKAAANEALAYFILGNAKQAHELTHALRLKFPYSARILTIWIQTAPADVGFEHLVDTVPSILASDGEVSAALAAKAISYGQFERARKLAIQAELSHPKWSHPRGLHGQAVVLRILEAHDIEDFQHVPSVSASLKEAEECFTEALDLAGYERAYDSQAEYLLQRAHTRRLLLNNEGADADVLHAYAIAPENVTVIRDLAHLELQRSHIDKAISLLRQATGKEVRPDLQLRLAEALARRNTVADRAEASSLLSAIARFPGTMPERMRKHVLLLAVESLVVEKKYGDADDLCKELAGAQNIPAALSCCLEAKIALAKGDMGTATQLASLAFDNVTQASTREDIRVVSMVLDQLGQFQKALGLWQRIARLDEFSSDTKRLLDCAARLKRDDLTLQICRTLRNSGVNSRDLMLYELDRLETYDVEEAINVLNTYLVAHPDDKLLRLRRSRLGLQWSRPDVVDAAPVHMPSVTDVNPSVGNAVVHVMKLGGFPDDALNYAYHLLRSNFGDPDAHRAFMFNLHPIAPRPAIKVPSQVEVGVAVAFIEDGETEQRWAVIEDAADPDQTRDEYPASHPLVTNMLGKQLGDQFVLARGNVADRRATIVNLLDKYIFRYQDCLKNWQLRFPNEAYLESVKVKAAGAGSDDPPDLTAVFASVDRRYESIRKAQELYRTELIPIHLIGQRFGKSSFEIVTALALDDKASVICASGTSAEREEAIAALEIGNTVVLDVTAIATLSLLQLENVIQSWPWDVLVAQSSIAEIQDMLSHEKMFDGESGVLSRVSEGTSFLKRAVNRANYGCNAWRTYLRFCKHPAKLSVA